MSELRVSVFQVTVVKWLGNTPVVVYEAKEPAEIYILPSTCVWRSG